MSLVLKKPVATGSRVYGGPLKVEIAYVPVISGTGFASAFTAVSATAATFATAMVAGKQYLYTCSCDSYIRQSPAGTAATVGALSMFVAKGTEVYIDGGQAAKLSVVADAALTGNATLVEVTG